MKKGSFAVLILATIVAAAPDALADHCYRCYNYTTCFPATQYGRPICDDSSGRCVFSGNTCFGPHPFVDVEEPFAAKFIVAAVERTDEPNAAPADTEPRVASLETPQQTTDR